MSQSAACIDSSEVDAHTPSSLVPPPTTSIVQATLSWRANKSSRADSGAVDRTGNRCVNQPPLTPVTTQLHFALVYTHSKRTTTPKCYLPKPTSNSRHHPHQHGLFCCFSIWSVPDYHSPLPMRFASTGRDCTETNEHRLPLPIVYIDGWRALGRPSQAPTACAHPHTIMGCFPFPFSL